MPVITREVTIPANSTNDNVFSGSAFEFIRQPSVVSVGITAAAVGLFAYLQSGADIIAEEFTPPVQTRFPIVPDEFYYSDFAAPGDRMVLRVRNSTGAGIICRAIAQITETRG